MPGSLIEKPQAQQFTVEQALQLAIQHHQAGKLQEAEQLYLAILSVYPNHILANHYMSIVACQAGNLDISIAYRNKITEIAGDYLSSDYARYLYEVGKFLGKSGNLEISEKFLRKSIDVFKDVNFYVGLGACLILMEKTGEAESVLRDALTLDQNNISAQINMCTLLKKQGKILEAEGLVEKIISTNDVDNKTLCDALTILGQVRMEQERLEEAEHYYKKAITIKPDNQETLWELSCVLLLSGRYREGLPYHDSRFFLNKNNPLRFDSYRMWNGEDIAGKRILVWAEQGHGDQIQAFRYLKKLRERGGEVLVDTNPELVSLFRNSPWPSQVIPKGESVPDYDIHIPFMSLPRILFEEAEFFSQPIPYLQAGKKKLEHWQKLLSTIPGHRVGIVWAGNPLHKNDRNRSIPLEHLAPLAEIPGVSVVSVQKGSGESQVGDCPFPLIHLGSQIQDFEDTAAILEHLDLLISVDTSVAHLAGALGRPVWTLLPTAPDWRWMLEREDSPWYPSMRLFRQPARGDWDSVIHRVADELKTKIS